MTERGSQMKTSTNAHRATIQSVSPESYLRRKCACGARGSGCVACNRKRESELRRAAVNSDESASVTGIVAQVLGSPGQPLDAATRSFMEPRFGRDFSNVRVHTDARASDSARSVAALAYTVGRDIVFRDGHYSPETREGKSLLAHELTHVAQNNGARWSPAEPISIGPPGDRFEAEADARAHAMANGSLRSSPGNEITSNSEIGRMSRSTFQVGSSKIEVNFDALGNMPVKDYEKEIEKRFTTWTGAKASTIHSSITKLSGVEKEFVLFGLDLLQDNPLKGLDKLQAVNRLIARAPKANTRPLGGTGNQFAEEVLSVTGWFEKALTSGLSAPTGTSLSTVQGLLGVTSSGGGSAPSASCPSPRKPEDQLKKTEFETELPKRLVTYLGKVAIAKTPVAQGMPSLLKAADEVQKQSRKFYSPYADRSTGTGNTVLQSWQYSAHTISAQSAQATPKPEVRTAYIASRSNKVGDLGLFGEVKYDWRCAADKKVLADLVIQMEKDTTIQPMVDKILREKSYTAQDADPKFVVLDPQYDSSKTTECDGRWKTVKTLCHELMHVMVHPNFHSAEKNRQLLTEGFPEVLGHYLYKDIRNKAGSDAKLKGVMEDGIAKPCATIPDSTIEYVPGGPNAEKIRNEVGDDNFRAAFFQGQVSLVGIMPKRVVDRGNDPREQEADRAAQSVVDSKPLQTSISPAPFSMKSRYLTNESGTPLDPNLRREMESGFGRDFSHVRVHTDSASADSAASLGSLAYTVGNDIVFGARQYAPETAAGRRLVAHELTHVVQQRSAPRSLSSVTTIDSDAGAEAEARAVEGSMGNGLSIRPQAVRGPAVQRKATTEEQFVSSAQAEGFLNAAAAKTTAAFTKALAATKTPKDAEALVKKTGDDLWQSATTAAKAGGAGTDDRQIYWTRLMLTSELRQWKPTWIKDPDAVEKLQKQLIQLLEQTSRGMTSATFPTDKDKKRILASGFDPFGFTSKGDIRQSNLSGAIALALDGDTLTEGSVSARVEAAIFPVRYADFNEGIVENYLRPKLTSAQPPHLVMSISQGLSKFELEEFAGRRRSTDKFADNLGQTTGSPTKPVEPTGIASGAEFIKHTVPPPMLDAMRGAAGRKGAIIEETGVQDLPPGAAQPRKLPQGPGSTPESVKTPGLAVEGSGGGFLSNEIFYRNSLLQVTSKTKVPMIHLHTPMLPAGESDKTRNTLIDTAKKILRAALPHL